MWTCSVVSMLARMPELPEVETVRRALAPILTGATVVGVQVLHPRTARRNERPADVEDRLRGRRVLDVGRHGKFLEMPLEGDLLWVVHLGMSGRIVVADPSDPFVPHLRFRAVTDRGDDVRLVDPRTFGFVAVFTPEELAASTLPALGPDALTELPTSSELASRLAGRTAPIKALLLDQRILAGLGNIYTDEALHRAGIDPLRPGGQLTVEDLDRLRRSIRVVLDEGIRHGGTSLSDLAYLLPDGRAGRFLHRLRVYGREGEPCRVCGTRIIRKVVAGRSTYSCPSCQT